MPLPNLLLPLPTSSDYGLAVYPAWLLLVFGFQVESFPLIFRFQDEVTVDNNFLFLTKYKPSIPKGRSPMESLRHHLENVKVSTSSLSSFREWIDSRSLDQLFELFLFCEDFSPSQQLEENEGQISDDEYGEEDEDEGVDVEADAVDKEADDEEGGRPQ